MFPLIYKNAPRDSLNFSLQPGNVTSQAGDEVRCLGLEAVKTKSHMVLMIYFDIFNSIF